MTSRPTTTAGWRHRTVEIRVWKIVAAVILLPILVFWFKVVHQDDEILALIRSEVVTDSAGQRTWEGSFVNTNEQPLREVAVTVDFLDSQDRTVGKAEARAAELPFGVQLTLQSPLPDAAARLRIRSAQWRMGERGVLLGPFRQPWEFGYLMADPAGIVSVPSTTPSAREVPYHTL